MADATEGKTHVLLYAVDASGNLARVQLGSSGGLPIQLQSAAATLDVRLTSSVAAADINVNLRTAAAANTINVQQRTPSVTYLLSSTGAVCVGAVTQPTSVNRAFQVVKTGGGDLTHLLQASLDTIATTTASAAVWITLMTSTASEGTATNVPWRFIRSRISAVSGSARCVAFMCA